MSEGIGEEEWETLSNILRECQAQMLNPRHSNFLETTRREHRGKRGDWDKGRREDGRNRIHVPAVQSPSVIGWNEPIDWPPGLTVIHVRGPRTNGSSSPNV